MKIKKKTSWTMPSNNQQIPLNSEVSWASLNAVSFSVSEILIYVIRVIVRITQINISLTNRVKSGNFGHQVNSDIHLQTVEIQIRRPSHKDFHCLLSCFIFYSNNEAPRGICAPLIPENNALISPNP